MKNPKPTLALSALVCCLFASSVSNAIHAKVPWQRVYTGADSIIELNTSSLRFEPGNILRAEFRTVFSKPEHTSGEKQVEYKTRMEKIDFRLSDRRYRFFEISLLNSDGKAIQTKTADGSEDWRLLRPGGITERLYNAACVLTPLGAWKVVAYRYAEGDPKEMKTTPELDKLVGIRVHLHADSAQVGEKLCRSPWFQDTDSTHDDVLRQLGIDWKSIGIRPEDARTINVRCEASGWQPSQSLLIKDNNKKELLMLWDGVFLVLERTDGGDFHGAGGNRLPTFKRRP